MDYLPNCECETKWASQNHVSHLLGESDVSTPSLIWSPAAERAAGDE